MLIFVFFSYQLDFSPHIYPRCVITVPRNQIFVFRFFDRKKIVSLAFKNCDTVKIFMFHFIFILFYSILSSKIHLASNTIINYGQYQRFTKLLKFNKCVSFLPICYSFPRVTRILFQRLINCCFVYDIIVYVIYDHYFCLITDHLSRNLNYSYN